MTNTPHGAVTKAVRLPHKEGTPEQIASAAIEALRQNVRALDRDHSPPSNSPTDWELYVDAYIEAVRDILGLPTEENK